MFCNLDSWRQATVHAEDAIVSFTVVQRSGSLSPQTFQHKNESSY
jgi:hypothetical protein